MITIHENYNNLIKKENIISFNDIHHKHIPTDSGVYCFWWIDKSIDINSIQPRIILKGGKQNHHITLTNWYNNELNEKPLYVGKANNIRSRIFQNHLKRSMDTERSLNWWLKQILSNKKPTQIIKDHIGISWVLVSSEVERFFMENMFIGILRPWFNLRSES